MHLSFRSFAALFIAALLSLRVFAAAPSDENFESYGFGGLSNPQTLGGFVYETDGNITLGIDNTGSYGSGIGSGKVLVVDYIYDAGATYFEIRSSSLSDDFKLVSMMVDAIHPAWATAYVVTGYNGGSGTAPVASDTLNLTATDSSGSIAYTRNGSSAVGGGVLTFDSTWQNIDTIRFTATNGIGVSMEVDNIDISAAVTATPPVISSSLTASGTYGSAISTYTITGTNTPTSYSATGLPPGLSVNTGNGQITGTPTSTAGSPYSVTIGATNAGGTGTATLVFTINKKGLTISGTTASSRTYDGTTSATSQLNFGSASLSGVIAGDVGSVTINSASATGTFADRNVNTGKAITIASVALSGSAATHYTLTQPTGVTGDVTAKALTVTGLSGTTQTYNGTAVATLTGTAAFQTAETAGSGTTSDGKPYTVDTISIGGTAAGAFVARNVGTAKGITVTGLTVTGTDSGNYTVTQPTGLTGDVTAKALTVTGVSAVGTQVYNGTNTAAITGTPAFQTAETAGSGTTSDGKPYTVDTISIGGTAAATFVTRNVGTAKNITVSGLTVTGTDSGNYSVTQPTGLTGDITQKSLTVSGLSTSNRTYDGTVAATLSGTSAFLTAETAGTGTTSDGKPYTVDSVTPGGTAAGTFADRHVGISKSVTVTGLTVTGTGNGNYSVTQPTGLTADIAAKALTVSGLSASGKTYDGTTDASLSGTAAFLTAGTPGSGTTSDGAPYTVDTISIGGTAAGAFVDRHVGTGKSVTVTGVTVGGTDSGNYTVTQPTGVTANIGAKALTISGVTGTAKTYDGTVSATLGGTAAFLTAETAGTGTTSDGKPYTVDTISIGGTVAGTFADRHVGTAKSIAVTGITVAGTDNGNYTVTPPTGVTANITAKSLSVSGVSAGNKTYDGTTDATLSGTAAFPTAEAAGTGATSDGKPYTVDTVSISGTVVGVFADRHVGLAKSVIVTGATITGTDSGNYNVTQPTGVTADISAKALTISGLSASNKTYDGTVSATLGGTAAFLAAEVAGTGTTSDGKPYTLDTITLSGSAAGVFGDRHVGTGKSITVTGLTVGGTHGANYTATQPSGVTADIGAKALTISGVSGIAKTYDGTVLVSLSGTAAFLTAEAAGAGTTSDGKPYTVDTISIGGSAVGTFTDRHVGTAKSITVSGVAVGGADGGNYTAMQPTGVTADITGKALTVSGVSATNKTYDGTTAVTLGGTATFLTAEAAGTGTTSDGKPYTVDTISLGGTAAGMFVDRHVGTAKAITVTSVTVTGTDSGNYFVTQPTGVTANITAKALSVSGLSATASRVYDGTTTATFTGTAAFLTAEAAGTGTISDGKPYTVDTISIGGTAAGAFVDRHVGTGKSLTITGVTISGANSGNYTVTQPTGLTANITAKALTITGLTASNKSYDASTSATLTGTAALQSAEAAGAGTTSDGKPYTGDTVSVNGTASGTFATATAATAKTVTVAGLSLSGAQSTNYSLTTFTTTADITKAAATVALGSLSATYDGSAHAATATTTPGSLTVGFTYDGSGTAPTSAGSYAVVGTISDTNYSGTASGTLTIAKANQTVTFPSVGAVTVGSPVTLSATASSSLPVTFSLVSGNATVAGTSFTALDANTIVLRATQAGNSNYNAASTDQTVGSATKLPQSIVFAQPPNKAVSEGPFPVYATSTSGLTVSFAVQSGPATVSGNTVTLTGLPGTVTIVASQAGDATYLAATPVSCSFTVTTLGPVAFFGTIYEGSTPRGTLAAYISADRTSGTLIGFVPGQSGGFATAIHPDSSGAFSVSVTPLFKTSAVVSARPSGHSASSIEAAVVSTTWTFSGNVGSSSLTGSIPELGLTFTGAPDALSGTTSGIAGYYSSSLLGTGTGAVHSIVGTTGNIYVLAISSDLATGTTGTVSPSTGVFNVTLGSGVSLTGLVDAPTNTVDGAIVRTGGATTDFFGLRDGATPTRKIIALSTRAKVGSGDSVTITGFAIGGTVPRSMLLRAVGPGLASFGVSGTLVNPRLRVFQGSTLVVENDDWSTAANRDAIVAATTASGAFALTAGSKDSAILTTLPPGPYTAMIDGGAGVALAEIYDATVGATPEAQRLVAISTRGFVDTGHSIMIGGFVITGNSPKRMLVRAVGPGLTTYGVSGVLANPSLRLADSTGATVASNDDWGSGDTAALASAAASVGAFPLTSGSKDSAMIVTLSPGLYTALAEGVGGTTGIAIVEVYELP